MSVYAMIFSPTGGTEKVMEILGEEFCVDKKIDFTVNMDYSHLQFESEDICLVGVPSYGGRVPQIAVERIRQIKGNGAKAILVAVYGNRAFEDTLLELQNEVKASGFFVEGGIAAIAEHSIMHQFGEGRPDREDEKELRQFAREIKKKMEQEGERGELELPGNMPYREYTGVPMKPKTDKKCIRCGLCASKCPVGAIPKEKPSTTNESQCITCMRCIASCPAHARKVNKILLMAASKKMKKACESRKKNELFCRTIKE